MGSESEKEDSDINISMIGESLYLFKLYLSRNIFLVSKSNKKNSIFDFFNYKCFLGSPIDDQIKNVFGIYQKNKLEEKINPKEVLIVQVYKYNTLQDKIYLEMEKIRDPKYMPLILFLVDYKRDFCSNDEEYYDEDLNYPEEGKYVYNNAFPLSEIVDRFTIFISDYIYKKEYLLESDEKELTNSGNHKFEEIKNYLLRFFSYHNDLGQKFSIGKDNNKINYDLTQFYYLHTFNICCIGRNSTGKSSFINCLLYDKIAKIFNKRNQTAKKINYYQKTSDPIKVFEIPGFNDKLSVKNSILNLKILNQELDDIKDEIHVILYFLDSNDEGIFKEEEYEMIKNIFEQKNLKFLFIITKSNEETEKEEIISNINKGISKALGPIKFDKAYEIFLQVKAHENNCIFVNFDSKKYGQCKLFNKLISILKETNIYKTYDKKLFSYDKFNELLTKEIDIRKIRAKKILLDNSIGPSVEGILPGIDLAVQKCAINKIANIFGLEIVNLIQKNDDFIDKNNFNIINNFEIEEQNNNYYQLNESDFITNYNKNIYVYYSFIGKGSNLTAGYYFPYKCCENFINDLCKYYIEKVNLLSGSILKASEYLEWRIKNINE